MAHYRQHCEAHQKRFFGARDGIERLESLRDANLAKHKKLQRFIRELEQGDGLVQAFNEQIWFAMVDHVTIEAADLL